IVGLSVGFASTSTQAQQPVEIKFAAEVNGQPFSCGQSYKDIGTTKSTITPSDFRFFVSDVELIDAQGRATAVALTQDKTWQFENVVLLDFENASGPCRNGTVPMNTSVRGSVPAGKYTGMRFTLGVPFKLNHVDPTTAPAPLSSTAMFWTWQGGYKFLKVDMASAGTNALHGHGGAQGAGHGAGAASGFSFHLGSTMCASPSKTAAPTACANPNRLTVSFAQFDPSKQTVVADIGAVLTNANVDVNAAGTSPGCMSFLKDADCPPIMAALGLPYESHAAGSQRFFSIR
ncbi:MAG: hypothetical protein RLZZ192_1608, partial [Pseudomonadota bacterium]